jgi:signal transduction histidine kinase
VTPDPRQPASALPPPRRKLRTRLALLYAGLFFVSGIVLLAFADIPALTVNHTSPAPAANGSGGTPVGPQQVGHLHQVLAYSGAALVVLAVLSVALGWLVAGRALRPLRVITASARAISASNLHERLGLDSPYLEFTELGETLDGLFGRLEASFASQRHFVANASHELRTPLTAERTLLQVALADPDATAETLRATCRQLLELGEQQERLIAALLTLATSQRGIDRWEPFDLAGITSNVVGQRRQEAERRGIGVAATLAAVLAAGDPSLAESLVANLVDNAIRHNVPGGWIKVSAAATAGAATISVSNTGPVIPPAEVGRLFQPFQRLGAERTRPAGGHGLGLAIVDAIAGAHGAALTAYARPEGGLDVEVHFPAAEATRVRRG